MTFKEFSMAQVGMVDSTLREGRQALSMNLGLESSKEYARLAGSLGVDILETTHPSSSVVMRKVIDGISEMGLNTRLATHIRARPEDVEAALQTRADTLHLYIPINPVHPDESKRNIALGLATVKSLVPVARKQGKDIRVSLEHGLHIGSDIFHDTYAKFAKLGVDRVGLAETTGTSLPNELTDRLGLIFSVTPLEMPVEVHLHQDLGLATAKLYAILAQIAGNGRRIDFDVSLGGYGDRNGILSHGALLSILYRLVGQENLSQRYAIDRYASLVSFFEQNSGLFIPYSDPLSRASFTHSAGPHLKAMTNGGGYQDIDPKHFGYTESVLNIGHAVTGAEGIRWFMNRNNQEISKADAVRLAADVRQYCAVYGPLSNTELYKFLLAKL